MTDVDLELDDPVLITKRQAKVFHVPDEEDGVVIPACRTQPNIGRWKEKEYRHVKGWKRPCQNDACFGEEERHERPISVLEEALGES